MDFFELIPEWLILWVILFALLFVGYLPTETLVYNIGY